MAGDHLPGAWSGWATLASTTALVLATMGAGVAAVRRYINTTLNAWRKGDEQINRRITDVSEGYLRDMDAFRQSFTVRMDRHEGHDDERFAKQDGRLDEIRKEMARRDDIARVESKIDQLLLGEATRRN